MRILKAQLSDGTKRFRVYEPETGRGHEIAASVSGSSWKECGKGSAPWQTLVLLLERGGFSRDVAVDGGGTGRKFQKAV